MDSISPFFIFDSVIIDGKSFYIGYYDETFKDMAGFNCTLIRYKEAVNIHCIIHDYKPTNV